MSFTTAKLTELPLRSSLPLASHSLFSSSAAKHNSIRHIRIALYSSSCSSSLRTNRNPRTNNRAEPTSTRLSRWPPRRPAGNDAPKKVISQSDGQDRNRQLTGDKGDNAIDRIVLRLRNLGLGSDDDIEDESDIEGDSGELAPVTGNEKLADLLEREWIRPDTALYSDNEDDDDSVLPWEKGDGGGRDWEGQKGEEKKRFVRAPSLAELTMEDGELKRLRRMGMYLRERISIPKAGLTKEVMQKIQDKWRKEELVRLKFHEVLARDMKTAHEIVEVGCLVSFEFFC